MQTVLTLPFPEWFVWMLAIVLCLTAVLICLELAQERRAKRREIRRF